MELTRFLGTNTELIIDELKNSCETHPSLYGLMCYNMLNEDDIESLKMRKTYLRIFVKQDKHNSNAYIQCYIREINRMLDIHKEEADYILNEENNINLILLEINYVTRGFFFLFDTRTKIGFSPYDEN